MTKINLKLFDYQYKSENYWMTKKILILSDYRKNLNKSFNFQTCDHPMPSDPLQQQWGIVNWKRRSV